MITTHSKWIYTHINPHLPRTEEIGLEITYIHMTEFGSQNLLEILANKKHKIFKNSSWAGSTRIFFQKFGLSLNSNLWKLKLNKIRVSERLNSKKCGKKKCFLETFRGLREGSPCHSKDLPKNRVNLEIQTFGVWSPPRAVVFTNN